MHPLIARIHPAFRTALLAWLLSRGALWTVSSPKSLAIETGAPLPGLLATALSHISSGLSPGPATALLDLAPWVFLELLLLLAGLSVYRFARKSELPQFAERACWFWFFNPILALTFFDWGAQLAAAAGAITLSALITHRPRRAWLTAVLAMGCRLEFILLAPAIAWAARRGYRPDKDPPHSPWIGALVVPLSFSGFIALTWSLAGSAQVSFRALHHSQVSWRTLENLTLNFSGDILFLLATFGLILLAIRYARSLPLGYLLVALPALLFPLLQLPAHLGAITLCWSLPSFVHLAKITDDRALERLLLAGLIIAFLVTAGLG